MVLPLALATAWGSSSSPASSGGTVTIGFQGPLSGPNSPQLGINALDGVKLAIKQANDAKALPYTLKVDSSDDQGDPAVGPTAAKKLVDDKVLAIIGPIFSGATKAS